MSIASPAKALLEVLSIGCGHGLGAETAPVDVARRGPLTHPLAAFAVAIRYVRFTSIPDVQSR
jgi:hypothetical protein